MDTITTMCPTPAATRLRDLSTFAAPSTVTLVRTAALTIGLFGSRGDAWTYISEQTSVRPVPNHGTGVDAGVGNELMSHNYNATDKQGRPPREVRR